MGSWAQPSLLPSHGLRPNCNTRHQAHIGHDIEVWPFPRYATANAPPSRSRKVKAKAQIRGLCTEKLRTFLAAKDNMYSRGSYLKGTNPQESRNCLI
jgi:hypothetical protein